MSDYKKLLLEARDEKNQWEEQIQQFFVNLGQLLMKKGEPEPSFKEPIDQKKKALSENLKKIETLKEIQIQLSEIEEKEKTIKKSHKEKKSEMVELYEQIGIQSYQSFKSGNWNEAGYDAVFEKLSKLEDKIQDADNDLFRMRTSMESKGFFKKINHKVREKTNQTIKKSAGGSMQKQYIKAGELLLDFASFEKHFEVEFPELYKQYSAQIETLEEFEKTLTSLQQNQSKLIEKAGMEARLIHKALSQLEEDVDDLEQELDHQYLILGRDHWENGKVPASWEDQKEQYEALHKSDSISAMKIEEIQLQISREAMISDKQVLEKKHSKKKEQLEELQRDMQALNDSIEGIDRELKDADKKLNKLQKDIGKGENPK